MSKRVDTETKWRKVRVLRKIGGNHKLFPESLKSYKRLAGKIISISVKSIPADPLVWKCGVRRVWQVHPDEIKRAWGKDAGLFKGVAHVCRHMVDA